MRVVLSREQMQAFDRRAIVDCLVPGVVLMENAGRHATEAVVRAMEASGATRACVVCGPGNNGGDGYVVARHLKVAGRNVTVISLVPLPKLTGDARLNAEAWCGIGGAIEQLDGRSAAERLRELCAEPFVLVDGLLGTGLDREVREDYRMVIESINGARAHRIALDMPSGLHANTGEVMGAAVRADTTVTFGHPKLGLLTTQGLVHAGTIQIVDIGVPGQLWQHVGKSADWVTQGDVAALLPARPRDEHKVSAGRVAVVAGSPGKVGAALLAARAVLRAGAGLVTIASHADAMPALEGHLPEAMTWRIDAQNVRESLESLLSGQGAALVGPGLGLDERAAAIVAFLALHWPGPVTLDADAITLLARDPAALRKAAGPRILTPHSGELARLLGASSSDVERNRFDAIRQAVELTGSVVLLKGPATLIGAPGQTQRIVTSGSSVLATGGAGDVLGGMVAAFSTKLGAFDAATVGSWLHGRAAATWAQARSSPDRGLLAHELADHVPIAIASLTAEPTPLTD